MLTKNKFRLRKTQPNTGNTISTSPSSGFFATVDPSSGFFARVLCDQRYRNLQNFIIFTAFGEMSSSSAYARLRPLARVTKILKNSLLVPVSLGCFSLCTYGLHLL